MYEVKFLNGKINTWIGVMSKAPLGMFNTTLVTHVTEECKLEQLRISSKKWRAYNLTEGKNILIC